MKKILIFVFFFILLSLNCQKQPIAKQKPVYKFFRVKEVDKDGQTTYSKTIKIKVNPQN